MNIKEKILTNPQNQLLLKHFGIGANPYFESWGDVEIAYEGEKHLFEYLAYDLPLLTKYRLDINCVLINGETGLIFGFHYGRFTFIFRCDFERNGIKNHDKYRVAETLDGSIDIRDLGENWAVLNHFEDEEKEQIEWAYELTKK